MNVEQIRHVPFQRGQRQLEHRRHGLRAFVPTEVSLLARHRPPQWQASFA